MSRCHTDEQFQDVGRPRIFLRALWIIGFCAFLDLRHELKESPGDILHPSSTPGWPIYVRFAGLVRVFPMRMAKVDYSRPTIIRKSIKAGFGLGDLPNFEKLCEKSDDKLFRGLTFVDTHPLHRLPPLSRY